MKANNKLSGEIDTKEFLSLIYAMYHGVVFKLCRHRDYAAVSYTDLAKDILDRNPPYHLWEFPERNWNIEFC